MNFLPHRSPSLPHSPSSPPGGLFRRVVPPLAGLQISVDRFTHFPFPSFATILAILFEMALRQLAFTALALASIGLSLPLIGRQNAEKLVIAQ